MSFFSPLLLLLSCCFAAKLESAMWIATAWTGPARYHHSGVLLPLDNSSDDAAHGAWFFGGLRDALHDVCDVDVLQLASHDWRQLHRDCVESPESPNGPPFARHAFSAVYAPRAGAVFVHGGCAMNRVSHRVGVVAHTSKFRVTAGSSLLGWQEVVPFNVETFHPPPRAEHTAVLHTSDAGAERMFVYGGRGNGIDWVRGDVVVLDVAATTWSVASTLGRNVSGHAALLRGNDMYVFGGWDGRGVFYTDLAVFDVVRALWSYPAVAAGSDVPGRRRHASFTRVVLDESDFGLLFGGFVLRDDSFVLPTDGVFGVEPGAWQGARDKLYADGMWRLDFATLAWTQLADLVADGAAAPPRLFWPSVLYRAAERELLVYGGTADAQNATAVGGVWRLALNHCPPDKTGADCATAVDCSALGECGGNGVCVGANVCRCKAGFEGAACDAFNCAFVYNCSTHGRCVAASTCACEAAFEGDGCEFLLGSRTPSAPAAGDAPPSLFVVAKESHLNAEVLVPLLVLFGVMLLIAVVIVVAGALLKRSYDGGSQRSALPRFGAPSYPKNLQL